MNAWKRSRIVGLTVIAYELPNPGILKALLGAMKTSEFAAASSDTVAKG